MLLHGAHGRASIHPGLCSALDDIRDAETVRTLLMDLQDVRRAKMRLTLSNVADVSAVKFNNVTLMEINAVRAFVAETLGTFHRLADAQANAQME